MTMKVNDLIELLEYSPATAPVCVAVVGADGRVRHHGGPWFLARERGVCLVVDERAEAAEGGEVAAAEIALSDYERPQLFGHRFVLLPKPDQAARRRS